MKPYVKVNNFSFEFTGKPGETVSPAAASCFEIHVGSVCTAVNITKIKVIEDEAFNSQFINL